MKSERLRECVAGEGGMLKIDLSNRASVVLPLEEGPERAMRKVLNGFAAVLVVVMVVVLEGIL